MIDLTKETPLTAAVACRHHLLRRSGRPLCRSVLHRWLTQGLRSGRTGKQVVLESFMQGGLRLTTSEAIERFLARLNGTDAAAGPTPAQVKSNHAAAERELAAAGI